MTTEWHTEHVADGTVYAEEYYRVMAGDTRVAIVFKDGKLTDQDVEAAAELIAKAPKMLDALKAWKSAEKYAHDYAHIPEAYEHIAKTWEEAMQLRDAALGCEEAQAQDKFRKNTPTTGALTLGAAMNINQIEEVRKLLGQVKHLHTVKDALINAEKAHTRLDVMPPKQANGWQSYNVDLPKQILVVAVSNQLVAVKNQLFDLGVIVQQTPPKPEPEAFDPDEYLS